MRPLHTLPFGLRVKVIYPSLILGHNLTHKFLSHLHRETGDTLKYKACSSFDLWSTFWGPIELRLLTSLIHRSRQTELPKTYARLSSGIMHTTSPITHDQTGHKLNVCVCCNLFMAPSPFTLSILLLNSAAHFFTML